MNIILMIVLKKEAVFYKTNSETKVIKCDQFPYESIDSGLFYDKINKRLKKKNIKFFKNINDLNTMSFIFNSLPSIKEDNDSIYGNFFMV